MEVEGDFLRIKLTVLAKCCAPPSSKSSLSTEVITTCFKPSLLTAIATLAGSNKSKSLGFPVDTLQKAQALVHISPNIIKVACFFDQQDPILGQDASWQTVKTLWVSTIFFVSK